jgi:hypothetical protein
VTPRSLELVRAGEHREGGLRSEPLETVRELVASHPCSQFYRVSSLVDGRSS